MSLPQPWVDKLFAKLTLTYGEAFMRQYGGVPMEDVKANWSHELSGFQQMPDAIAYGLQNLPADRPPNVLQFRDACRRAPSKQLALEHSHQHADPEVIAQVRAVFAGWKGERDPKAWATKLQQRHARGERLTAHQVRCYREALGVDQPQEGFA